jgi:hypothetical protein
MAYQENKQQMLVRIGGAVRGECCGRWNLYILMLGIEVSAVTMEISM